MDYSWTKVRARTLSYLQEPRAHSSLRCRDKTWRIRVLEDKADLNRKIQRGGAREQQWGAGNSTGEQRAVLGHLWDKVWWNWLIRCIDEHIHIQGFLNLSPGLWILISPIHRVSGISLKHTFPCTDSKCVSHLPPWLYRLLNPFLSAKMPEPVLGAASRKVLNNRGAWQNSKALRLQAGGQAGWPHQGRHLQPGSMETQRKRLAFLERFLPCTGCRLQSHFLIKPRLSRERL